jgi:transposase
MIIHEREPGDLERLRLMARAEKHAEQKDRLLSVAHAIAGRQTLDIADAVGRSRKFVQRWVYAYRDGGIDAVRDKPRGGTKPRLNSGHSQQLRERLDAGPRPEDRVCTLRGRDVQRIIREELNTDLSLSGVYRQLHRMGYSCLAPRPRHEKQDPAAQKKFKEETAPLL